MTAGAFQTSCAFGNADLAEHLLPQIFHNRLAGQTFYHSAQHEGTGAVVLEDGAGGTGLGGIIGKIELYPVVGSGSEPALT